MHFSILSDLKKSTVVVEACLKLQPDVLLQRLPAYYKTDSHVCLPQVHIYMKRERERETYTDMHMDLNSTGSSTVWKIHLHFLSSWCLWLFILQTAWWWPLHILWGWSSEASQSCSSRVRHDWTQQPENRNWHNICTYPCANFASYIRSSSITFCVFCYCLYFSVCLWSLCLLHVVYCSYCGVTGVIGGLIGGQVVAAIHGG